jgi:chaperonin GroEL
VRIDVPRPELLTTEVMIAEAPKDDDHAHPAPGGMGGMGGMDM